MPCPSVSLVPSLQTLRSPGTRATLRSRAGYYIYMLMMDMNDSGGSASSQDNFAVSSRACVSSCSFGYQDFSTLPVLYDAVKDIILEKVGCTAHLNGVVRGSDNRDLLSHLPAALLAW